MTSLYPLSTKEKLRNQFIGKSIKDVATPAAVLDLSKLRDNCSRMLEACKSLDMGWRAHIKTHKTTELTRLQVGDGTGPVNIIVSTVIEAEHVVPLLLEYKSAGRSVNLLYAFPVPASSVPRLSIVSKALGPHGLSLMVDHVAQLTSVIAIYESSGIAPDVFVKIDVGAKRAGVSPTSDTTSILIAAVLSAASSGTANFHGLYAHAGQSYNGSNPATAIDLLRLEFASLLLVAHAVRSLSPFLPLVLSVGATPTTTSIRNLLLSTSQSEAETAAVDTLRKTIQDIRDLDCRLEIHAGVYPTLDIQQLSTNALPTSGPNALLTWSDLAVSVLAEIASIYPNRGANDTTEYLITAGTLALGREPCKSYPGWGVLTPWNRSNIEKLVGEVAEFEGWIVGRISQEHGIVTWHGKAGGNQGEFEIGQKVRVWPNHSCISGAGFGWYLVVDSSLEGREDEIVDVWVRWRGW